MRALASLALALVALVPAATAGGPPRTELRITVWPNGPAKTAHRWSLTCAPRSGTLPGGARACGGLEALDRPFAPIPPDTACTEIYGGPAEALVTGHYGTRRIWARFNRTDGCRIDRWARHAFLFGGVRLGSA